MKIFDNRCIYIHQGILVSSNCFWFSFLFAYSAFESYPYQLKINLFLSKTKEFRCLDTISLIVRTKTSKGYISPASFEICYHQFYASKLSRQSNTSFRSLQDHIINANNTLCLWPATMKNYLHIVLHHEYKVVPWLAS